MAQGEMGTWLRFALQQIAAESYFDWIDLSNPQRVIGQLQLGNNNVTGDDPTAPVLPGKIRMTTLQAEQFVQRYQIVDHHANDATGFSATLLVDTETNSYTLSFRSSEYAADVNGGDRSRDILGADAEVKNSGFAFAQLVSMTRYFEGLQQGKRSDGTIDPSLAAFFGNSQNQLNVTGYSLGGHLATVFTELYADRVAQTYTFNGAGRGEFGSVQLNGEAQEAERIREMLANLDSRLRTTDPLGSLFVSGATGDIYTDERYVVALDATQILYPTSGTQILPGLTGGITRTDGAFGKIQQIFGHADTGQDVEVVANSGVHAKAIQVLIEGQPLVEDVNIQNPWESQYGNSHSIALIVDSLAIQELFQKADPQLQQAQIESILKASSGQVAIPYPEQGMPVPLAEGDTLEKALDALARVFHVDGVATPFGRLPGDFGSLTYRQPFYERLEAVRTAIGHQVLSIVPLMGKSAEELQTLASLESSTSLAYRFALRELTPFAVLGASASSTEALYASHNEAGELALVNPESGIGELSSQYLKDRAAFLIEKINVNSSPIGLPSVTHFKDFQSSYEIGSATLPLPQVLFGDEVGETLDGSVFRGDHLYGGDGNDHLFGYGGKDYLEGNRGNDILDGGSGADTILGGTGDDTYLVDDSGDIVREYANSGVDEVRSSVTFTLDSQIEYLTLTGSNAIDGIGNELGNILIGNSAKNVLNGGDGQDHLVGNEGNDTLIGGAGNSDLLEGGVGFDTYIYRSGDGVDRIEDSDVQGQIIFDDHLLQGGIRRAGDAANSYTSLDGRTTYMMSGTDLIVNGVLIVNENFQSGQMGIQLRDVSPIPTDTGLPAGPFGHVLEGGSGDETLIATNPYSYAMYGNEGDDVLTSQVPSIHDSFSDLRDGGAGDDILVGAGGNDYLVGGSGDDYADVSDGDIFFGGDGNDIAVTDTEIANYAWTHIGSGTHYIDGGAGNDVLLGALGVDVLLGGEGEDVLRGENRPAGWIAKVYDVDLIPQSFPMPAFSSALGADDYLDGGAGNDLLVGDGGNDILIGGAGDDLLYGESDFTQTIPGDDWLDGGEGNDRLFGGAGADSLSGGDGDDLLIGDFSEDPGSADILDGGAGADELQGGGGDDILYGGIGMDRLAGFAGNDVLDGGADSDELQGGAGDDSLWGGLGHDLLTGQEGDDELFGDDGNDELHGETGNDTLLGGVGNDALFGQDDDDFLSGDAGDDVLNGGLGNDQLDGGDGIDDVQGREGDDLIVGGIGDDFLYGDGNNPTVLNLLGGNDTLDGEEGDDQLWGGAGQDQLFGGEGTDQLVGDVGDDALFGDAGDDSLFGDSPLFAGQAGNDVLDGGDGNDVLDAGGGEDDLHGGAGNDRLIGGAGSDTYRFNLGDGVDSIEDDATQSNRLVFGAGITAESLSLDVAPNDSLVVRVGNSEDAVQIAGFGLNSPSEFHTINQFEFADGTVLTDAGLLARGFNLSAPVDGGTMIGTSFADHMQGSQAADWLHGRDGNDVLIGGEGADVLEGEEGDDLLDGGAGSDRLYGGAGVNVLRGGAGSDLLVSNAVDDQLLGGTGDDIYHLASVLTTVSEDANAGVDTIHLAPSASLVFQAPDQVENVQILDDFYLESTQRVDLVGNVLDNQLSGPNQLDGQGGNDILIGVGDNTFLFDRGYGQDIVRMGMQTYAHSGLDQVLFGAEIAPGDLVLENHANDLIVKVNGSTDQLTVESFFVSSSNHVDQFAFLDGSVWDLSAIESRVLTFVGSDTDDTFYGNDGDNLIRGLGGNDQIRASLGDDTLDGGAGNDFLEGYVGNDIYLFGRGYGQDSIDDQGDSSDVDTLQLLEGVGPGDLTLRATPDFGTGVILTITNTADQLMLGGFFASASLRVDLIKFADGTIWDYNAMLAQTEGVNLVGGEDVDYLYGNVTNDILSGLGGDDSLYGGAGNDLLDGGIGADGMIGGSGNDLYTVDEVGDGVTEQAGQGTDTVQSSVTYALGANVENLTLIGNAAINGSGNSLNNILAGNGAVNVLTGGAGNDTYVVGAGDTIVEAAGSGTDIIRADISWTLGINVENLVLTGTAAVNGTGNSLANTLTGNSAANILNGGAGADRLIGGQGDDTYVVDNVSDQITESANEGLDTVQSSVTYTLAANVENLTLTGSGSINGTGNGLDNILVGNSAANRLTGGAGNDTYVIGTGDSIVESVNGGIDSVQSSVTHTLAANVENLTLTGSATINGTGNGLNNILIGNSAVNTLTGGAGNDTYIVGAGDTVVEASNAGTDTVQSAVTWSLGANVENLALVGSAAVNGTGNTLANVLTGNAGNNALIGGDGNDTMAGERGNDVLNGGTGNDVFQFARGDGQDTVSDTSGSRDRLNFGSGINPLDIMLSQSANDLRIALYGSTDQVTIANWYGGATNQIETVQAGNGQQLMSTQVNQLIQAMAGFTQQTGLSWEQAVAQRPQDVQQVLAANWH
jgi:Ca2+-binding RTX toxin-like protein